MKKLHTSIRMFLILLIALAITGCTPKKIFVSEEEKYMLVPFTSDQLSLETYYVKDGAKFYETYTPDGTSTGVLSAFSKEKYFWLTKDATLIPTLYSDEILAYSSSKASKLEDVVAERFYDVGYSMGIYGGKFDEDGYYCVSLKGNVVPNSSAYKAISKASSKDIRIVSVNDTPIDKSMLNDGGIFINLEKDKSYEIGYYAGTFYETAIITADYYFLQSYEKIEITSISSTKHGYLSLQMPAEAKSGYYYISGKGMFKYYNYEKGEYSDNEINMNERIYEENISQEFAYAQQYSLSVGAQLYNVGFSLEYDSLSAKEEDISITLISPSGTVYDMPAKDGLAYVELAEVYAGKWYIYAFPKELSVKNIDAVSAAQDPDSIKEEYVFTVDEAEKNMKFFCKYQGEGNVWGIVTNEKGEAQVLEKEKIDKETYLTTTYGYLPKGTYYMTVYHYLDTSIIDYGKEVDEENTDDEIIYIED